MKSTGDPGTTVSGPSSGPRLNDLVVFDRLEVGPVRVEPRRITATYTVVKSGARQSTELI